MKRRFINAFLFAAISIFLSVSSYGTTLPDAPSNVTIDGVKLDEYTYMQLRTIFSIKAEQRKKNFRLEITSGDKNFEYTADDVGWNSNVLTLLDSTWQARNASPVDLKSTVSYNWNRIQNIVDSITKSTYIPASNASFNGFSKTDDEFSFTPEVKGQTTDYETCRQLIYNCFKPDTTDNIRAVEIPVKFVEPTVKLDDLRNSYGLISKFTTKTTNVHNRNTNINLCSAAINGTELEAGQVFSFNDTLGYTSPERGFKIAGALSNGKPTTAYGGGICQVSSTIYNAVLNAGLEVVERHPHSASVGYVPKGKDATVNYGTLDFKFQNSTSDKLYIVIDYDNRILTCSLFGSNKH